MPFESFSQIVMAVAIVLPRLAAAFVLLPYFTSDTIPSMVRNVFFVSVSLAILPLVLASPPPNTIIGAAFLPILVKEVFIGISIGFSFGILFWALEGAGQVIDSKIGTTTAQLADPITGHQTTLIGTYLARLAGYVFAAFGGFRVFLDLLLSSYQIWPVLAPWPDLPAVGALFFIGRFDELMRLILLLSAPVLVVLTLLEVGLGFINRYAPQLNVFTLSTALKGWLAVPILLLMAGSFVSFIFDWLGDQQTLLRHLPLR